METKALYVMPSEECEHEGTWLQWPHNYGKVKRKESLSSYERPFIEITKALHIAEKVHIIAYNEMEKERIKSLLCEKDFVDTNQVDFFIIRTNDVWVRDNGPLYVLDENQQIVITNWKFNGWGEKVKEYDLDNAIPRNIGQALSMKVTNIPMTLEGGSIEIDGKGTLMAKRSSILNNNRNPNVTQANAEYYFRTYLGVTNFIWLDGVKGLDITDDHIDGYARFANKGDTIVTFPPKSHYFNSNEYKVLLSARNAHNGDKYNIVHLPTTRKKIVDTNEYGMYQNYYIGNDVILVPTYNDVEDDGAISIIQSLYPYRKIVGINCELLFRDGGMIHCVTQQQPKRVL